MIDIVIPTSFEPTLTYECIRSIQNVVKEPEYKILVIDNQSTPPFKMDGIESRRYEERLGFARAMNEGIRNTSGEYVLLLNNDTVIHQPQFLSSMLGVINSADDIGIVSPTCDFIGTPTAQFPNIASLPNDVYNNIGHVAAVCWLIKRSTIEKIGIFDEGYKIGAFEDGDYCHRILHANMKIMLDRRIWIKHYGSRTISRTPGYYEAFHKNHEYFNKKWGI